MRLLFALALGDEQEQEQALAALLGTWNANVERATPVEARESEAADLEGVFGSAGAGRQEDPTAGRPQGLDIAEEWPSPSQERRSERARRHGEHLLRVGRMSEVERVLLEQSSVVALSHTTLRKLHQLHPARSVPVGDAFGLDGVGIDAVHSWLSLPCSRQCGDAAEAPSPPATHIPPAAGMAVVARVRATAQAMSPRWGDLTPHAQGEALRDLMGAAQDALVGAVTVREPATPKVSRGGETPMSHYRHWQRSADHAAAGLAHARLRAAVIQSLRDGHDVDVLAGGLHDVDADIVDAGDTARVPCTSEGSDNMTSGGSGGRGGGGAGSAQPQVGGGRERLSSHLLLWNR